ncbi:MAG: serine/threonine-protein kinase [Acidobacteria bacterium]|nr:serine/threonine-protein kinase [Acidobacteriota bacterium]
MALQIGTRLGSYEILAQLGQGGMGEVYRATDTKLARTVALKVLSPALTGDADYMARFTREAHILASFNHPNIATIYGFEDSGSVRALVMELVEGRNLAECIAAGSLAMEDTLLIAKQIAEALEAAHDKGIVHRDLKPANIMLTPEGVVKVLDFGLAKQSETRASSGDPALSLTVRATQAGVVMGTAGYMAPEQAAARPADRRADIWAFGVVLWEMLCRKPLFSGESIAHTLADVLRAEIDLSKLPAETPPPIRDLLGRCLDRDVKKRLQAIGEARIAIEKYLADPKASTPIPTVTPAPSTRRAWLPWAAAAVFGCAALALSFTHFRETPPAERVLKFAVAAPENTLIHTFAISPDGRYLAMAVQKLGKRNLWVHTLDTLTTQEIKDTEDAMYPFWSPDSRTIAFFGSGRLRKVAADGGAPLVLCDAPDGRGGTWNRDGVIVFAPTNAGALQRVSAMGGVPVAATKRKGKEIHRFPHFLPDGNRFVYTENTGDAHGIYVGSLDGQTSWRLLPEVTSAVYQAAGDGIGHLLFLRQRTLVAQPIMEKSLQPAGGLFPVAQGILQGTHLNYSHVSVSTNGLLVYWNSATGAAQNQLSWFDRNGKPQGNVGAPGPVMELALSPDEKTVASRREAGQSTDIWLHEFARGVDARFTFDLSLNGEPVWAPDGRRLVFTSNRGGTSDLFLKDTSGSAQEERLLKTPPAGSRLPSDWARGGRTIVYREQGDLWVVNVDGERKPSPIYKTPFNESQAKFSPDGRWLAYSSDESGRLEVYVRPFPAGVGKWKVSINGGDLPQWRSDGKEIFYLSPERHLMAAGVKPGSGAQPSFEVETAQELFAMALPFFQPGFNQYPYAVTRDGKRFLVVTRGGGRNEQPLTVFSNWLGALRK